MPERAGIRVGFATAPSQVNFGRRSAMKLLAAAAILVSGGGVLFRTSAARAATRLALRKVTAPDAAQFAAIMNACVSDADAFHGKCEPWSLSWAEDLVGRCPDTVVITLDALPVAFHEIPPIGPAPASIGSAATDDAERRKQFLRERSRRTMRIRAVGVRADVLGATEAVQTFRRILYYGAKTGVAIGYEHAEAYVPWEHHPRMARKWTDYPGCELVYRSRNQSTGSYFYWLRWRLADLASALELEGADDARLTLV